MSDSDANSACNHHFVLYNEYVVEEKKNNKYMFIIHLFAVYEQKLSPPDHIQYYNENKINKL